MRQYRASRNLEASLIDYLVEELDNDGWEGIQCVKSLKRDKQGVILLKPPIILINVISNPRQKLEIGSGKFLTFPIVYIRIFATNDGQRLDLADWVLEKLEGDITYYSYMIDDGQVHTKHESGAISIINIARDEKELVNTNPESLEEEDRYRHLIEFSCYVGLTPDC